MDNELIQALQNVNLSSDTAEIIANQWMKLQWVKMIIGEISGWTVFGLSAWGIRTLWANRKSFS